MVQLKLTLDDETSFKKYRFNSCMVQLKSELYKPDWYVRISFNSCMVQLKSVTNIGFSV